MHEIILPEAKPALEWVNNRVLQKMSPKRKHSLAQTEFAIALGTYARERGNGMAGTEWHFQVRPPGEIARTLVPDVAFCRTIGCHSRSNRSQKFHGSRRM